MSENIGLLVFQQGEKMLSKNLPVSVLSKKRLIS